MSVLIDTTVWSLGLRRRRADLNPTERLIVAEWERLVRLRRAVLVGPVRQEVLSGIRRGDQFESLRARLRGFPDPPLVIEDHERAAEFYTRCLGGGVASTAIDMLLCAIAKRFDLPVFTTDGDFERYAKLLPIRLHRVRGSRTGPASHSPQR